MCVHYTTINNIHSSDSCRVCSKYLSLTIETRIHSEPWKALRPLRLSFLSFFASSSRITSHDLFPASTRLVLTRPPTATVFSSPPNHTRSPTRCLTREAEATSNPPRTSPVDWYRPCDRGACSRLTDARPPDIHAVGIAHLAVQPVSCTHFLSPILQVPLQLALGPTA
jgi:hypothetical protein